MNRSLSVRNKKICVDVSRIRTVNAIGASLVGSRGIRENMSEARFTSVLHTLDQGEAHVWNITVAPSPDRLTEWLSESEMERVRRFRDATARARFVTARVALRHILSGYLGTSAAAVNVQVEPRGKPVVDTLHGIHFSLSHTRHTTLLAVAATDIGVDVEHLRAPRHLMRIAWRVLHADTCRRLHALPPEDRALLFLRAWTQREAHVKAVGGGLFHTPDTLPLAPPAAGTIALVHDRSDNGPWSVAHFQPDDAEIAAVAARGQLRALRFFSWNPARVEREDE